MLSFGADGTSYLWDLKTKSILNSYRLTDQVPKGEEDQPLEGGLSTHTAHAAAQLSCFKH